MKNNLDKYKHIEKIFTKDIPEYLTNKLIEYDFSRFKLTDELDPRVLIPDDYKGFIDDILKYKEIDSLSSEDFMFIFVPDVKEFKNGYWLNEHTFPLFHEICIGHKLFNLLFEKHDYLTLDKNCLGRYGHYFYKLLEENPYYYYENDECCIISKIPQFSF